MFNLRIFHDCDIETAYSISIIFCKFFEQVILKKIFQCFKGIQINQQTSKMKELI